MKLLDAVNLILPKLGEHRVTSIDNKHPTLAIILPEIENELKKLLARGWWFNEFDYKAYPDSEGAIVLGTNTLEFTPKYPNTAVARGLSLYNPVTLSYVFDRYVEGRVREYVDFEQIPESAAQSVLYNALVSSYATDIGMTNEVLLWQMAASQAYSDLLAEHLRQKKHTTKNSRRWKNFICALRG